MYKVHLGQRQDQVDIHHTMQQPLKGCVRRAGWVEVLGVTHPGKGERSYTLKIHDEQTIDLLSKDGINKCHPKPGGNVSHGDPEANSLSPHPARDLKLVRSPKIP